MSADLPIRPSNRSRRRAPGRFGRRAPERCIHAAVMALLVGSMAACATVAPTASPNPAARSTTTLGTAVTASLQPQPDLSGLLVADGGSLRVTDPDGSLVAFDRRSDPAVEVAAGRGVVVVVGPEWLASWAPDPGSGARAWRPLALPTDGTTTRPLIAMGRDGSSLAVAIGRGVGRGLDLALVDVVDGTTRSIPVERGLNGPPSWVGPGVVALNVIGADQHSHFVAVDLATAAAADLPSFGFSLSATADGSTVALDDSASGEVLVGARADMTTDGIARMARIGAPPGLAPTDLALDSVGMRLAIVRRSDAAMSLELLDLIDGVWTSRRVLAFEADAILSIAWLR